jgi:hypothetical protein
LNFFQALGPRIHRDPNACLFSELEAVRIHIGDDHMPRAGKSCDECGHNTDRAGTGDENIFAKSGKRKRRMNGVSEGIENRRNLARNRMGVLPDVGHRQDHVLGKRACAVHSQPLRVRAQVPPPGQAIPAMPADDVAFPADEVTRMKILHIGADFDDLTAKFVTDNQRHMNRGSRPFIPVVNVQVGTADSRAKHANLHVADAGFRLGNIFEPETSLGATLNESFHSGIPLAKSTLWQK